MTELRRSARVAGQSTKHTAESIGEPAAKRAKKVEPKSKVETKAESKAKSKTESKAEPETHSKTKSIKELQIGDEIPDLVLKNQDDEDLSLREITKKNRIVVFFSYPRASTPGCTRQVCGYRDNYAELKEHAAVYGLSADSVKAQKNFQTKQNLQYDLISDPSRQFVGALGAKKTAQSGVTRSHWIFVDGKLRIKRVGISPEVSVKDGKKEVLELAEELK